MANAFADRGIEVDMVLSSAKGPYLSDLSSMIRVVDLKSPKVSRSLFGLKRYIEDRKPDSLLSHLNYANIIAIIANLLAKNKTRVFVVEHADVKSYFNNAGIKKRVIKYLSSALYGKSNGVVGVSYGVSDSIKNILGIDPRIVRTIYNPIYDKKYFGSINSINFDKSGIYRPVLLAAGRLTGQKDFHTLLRSFSIVREKVDASLVILGEGEDRSSLESLADDLGIRSFLSMPGFVTNPYEWMASADLFVMSSRFEGLPTVLIEALGCGAPVVSTSCPHGPEEILEGGRLGRLVPVGDSLALAEAIILSLTSPLSTREERKARAREFDIEAACSAYLELLFSDDVLPSA